MSGSIAVAEQGPARRGARTYFFASVIAQLCALARYTLLARLIGPEQLGMAATLVLTGQFFDSISDSGSDRFLIQDREGDGEGVQGLVQLVFVCRGLFSAAALVIFAGPIAALYGSPGLALGLCILSLSPLIFGLLHLDMRRAQRHHDFRSEGVGLLFSETASLVATVTAALLTRSYTAILYGLIVRSIALVAVSHALAHRRYFVRFSQAAAPRLAAFALPLMVNGLLLFLGSQGDRVLVANRLGVTALGYYSAVLLLVLTPTGMLTRYVSGIHLPRVAAGRDDSLSRENAAGALGGQTLILCILMCLGFVAVAPWALVALDGAKYGQSTLVIAIIGILQTNRFLRVWPNTVALAMGRSRIVLTGNIVRLVGYPAALAGAALHDGLLGIIGGFVVGEVAALVAGVVMLNYATGQSALREFDRLALFALSALLAVGYALVVAAPSTFGILMLLAGVATLVALLLWREMETVRGVAGWLTQLVARFHT